MTFRKVKVCAGMLSLALLSILPSVSPAQTAGGSLLGSVGDPQGASIPGAQISVINTTTGITR